MTDTDKKPEAPAVKKARQENEAKKAMAEYEAQAIATREKTARLRALRLAREAEMAALEPQKRKPPVRKTTSGTGASGRSGSATGKRGKAEKRPTGNLADWLDQQNRSGRRT
ncbi:MAG: hypothetical protein R3D62_12690 [Xanthobacteraceae bacterium]